MESFLGLLGGGVVPGEFAGWMPVTHGCSETVVRRSPDGRAYAKSALADLAAAELRDERDRLIWLAGTEVPCARVLDWLDGPRPTLVTSTVPGIAMCDAPSAPGVLDALIEALVLLHAIDPASCPFDRRLAVTVPQARKRAAAGAVDGCDFDAERRGRSVAEVLAELEDRLDSAALAEADDIVVAHGDPCLPNILIDPDTLRLTGVIDLGRLGLADRHCDLALATRSLASPSVNAQFGPRDAAAVLAHGLWAGRVDESRLALYRLLDEFF